MARKNPIVAPMPRAPSTLRQITLFRGAVLPLRQCRVEILIGSLTGEKPHQLDQPRIAPAAEGDDQPIRQFRFPSLRRGILTSIPA
jgi:hypothetical protein